MLIVLLLEYEGDMVDRRWDGCKVCNVFGGRW